LAKNRNSTSFAFNKPQISDYNYSFSGLKTSFLYLLRDKVKENPNFIAENMHDICASLQATIVDILMNKLRKAAKELNIKQVAMAGGVSANNGLRQAFIDHSAKYNWEIFIPPFEFTTDNAAMIAITGFYKYKNNDFCSMEEVPFSRITI
jgi:N6-L-threonylcarbamoyladenine synthase